MLLNLELKDWAKREFLNNLEIIPHYQPIVDLCALDLFGYEALSRFKLKGESLPPLAVFHMAEGMDLIGDLELMCKKLQLLSFPRLRKLHLFLNLFPSYLTSEHFGKNKTFELVKESGLKPELIILEISEAEKIQDCKLLKRAFEHYKSSGFKLAIDDLGTGYNSLKLLLEFEGYLDFVKIPREMVNGISRSKIKQQLVKMLTEITFNMGALPIYEGVEHEEDVEVIYHDLGGNLFQGFYFAKPMPAEDVIHFRLREELLKVAKKDLIKGEPLSIVFYNLQDRIGNFLSFIDQFQDRYFILDTGERAYFVDAWALKYSLDHKNRNLYYYKSLKEVLSKFSHIFEDIETIPKLSPEQLKVKTILDILLPLNRNHLLLRKDQGFYLLEKQHLLGIFYRELSKELLDRNSLTHLPGSSAIKEKVEELIRAGKEFYVCYIDIDNFKAFNDTYGFYLGDQMIKKVGLFLSLFEKEEPSKRFVGHIGGDDFVLILWDMDLDSIAQHLLNLFKELCGELRTFYSQEDIERGYFIGKDREDNLREFPIASLSGVLLKGSSDLIDISKRSAMYKKKAKAHKGTALFVESLNEILTITA